MTHRRTDRLPFNILTSSTEEDIIGKYNLRASVFVRKPVEFEPFMEVVELLQLYCLVLHELPPHR